MGEKMDEKNEIYFVKDFDGEYLDKICFSIFGEDSVSYMLKICEMNKGLFDFGDKIPEGTEIRIPTNFRKNKKGSVSIW